MAEKKTSGRIAKNRDKNLETPLEKSKKMPIFEDLNEEKIRKMLFEEDLARMRKTLEDDESESDYYEENRTLTHHKRDGEWDVPIDEEIQYFDPELSYELTGYRPINMNQGLDFDPTPFTEASRLFRETGKYTEYPFGCKPYADF